MHPSEAFQLILSGTDVNATHRWSFGNLFHGCLSNAPRSCFHPQTSLQHSRRLGHIIRPARQTEKLRSAICVLSPNSQDHKGGGARRWKTPVFLKLKKKIFMATPGAHGSSQARDWLWATAATQATPGATRDPLTPCTGLGIKPDSLQWPELSAVGFLTHWATATPWHQRSLLQVSC